MPVTHVLLIEDNPDLRETVCEFLELLDFQVTAASDGQEALEKLATDPLPDVILLDLMMPRMNGREFLAARESLPRVKEVPVIVMSAAKQDLTLRGIASFLEKPILPEKLQAEILAAVRR